ncbi:drug resistance transporter, EmrB/QacA subfamily [Mycolicibacterium rutilum]|uniref:Drug resistance transporter, EmrB/QacA subfamily n=1 Tax=Mycolicibacterium rutilum TaxID=370526 RepID=A0A1H6LTE4_MYCRU|nr:MFS transporter [Mycolicibacterium rutilum]SEH91982.1 drug resistance transporter, EmrB/QacA subfamily [Mycolicibacterium rutilum]
MTQVSPMPKVDGPPSSRMLTLVVGCLSVAVVVGSMVAFNTALGDVAAVTSATQTQLNWIVDGYTLALACLLLLAGAIGDRYGRRAALIGGLAVFSIASAAPVLFDAPTQVIAARLVAGAGAAFVMPAGLSLLSRAYPAEERAKVIGIWAAVAGCAGVLGLLGSGLVLANGEWQAICWALAGAGVVVLLAALTLSPDAEREHATGGIDWFGSLLIALAVALVVFGLLEAPTRGWTDWRTLGCLGCGALAAALFVLTERRMTAPLLDPRLFTDRLLAASAVTITALFAATFGFFYLGMQYAQLVLGYSALTAAGAFAPFAVPVVALSVLSHRIVPRWGPVRPLVAGLAVIAAGFASMLLLQPDSSYPNLLLSSVIIGAGIGLATAPATSTIMLALRDDQQGVASAINDTTRELGAAVGMAVAGSVLADRYAAEVSTRLAGLPRPLADEVADGFGKAVRIAQSLGPGGRPVAEASQQAFLTALHSSTTVLAVLSATAALAVAAISSARRTSSYE